MLWKLIPLLLLTLSSQNYKLNRSRARTSSVIQSGKIKLSVLEAIEHSEHGRVYPVKLDVKITVWYSDKEESSSFYLPESYYTNAFWSELKENDYAQLPDFKMKHIKAISSECDQVLIFDFERANNNVLLNNEAEIKSEVCRGLEGIGARYLDIKGTAQGFDYKAGFDLQG